jgi:hypothetical protein
MDTTLTLGKCISAGGTALSDGEAVMKNEATRSEIMDGRCAFKGERLLCCGLYGQFDSPFTNAIELFPGRRVSSLHEESGIAKNCIFGRTEDQAEEGLREGTSQ